MIITIMIVCCMVPILLIILNSFLFKKEEISREKLSPFECGFDPKTSSRMPFSIRFYMIAVIFLIFDIEITLILPVPMIMTLNNFTSWLSLISFFIILLLAGLYHEWSQGSLKWAN